MSNVIHSIYVVSALLHKDQAKESDSSVTSSIYMSIPHISNAFTW